MPADTAPAERLFFALWPPRPVREALVQVRAALPRPTGRENHPLDLHLTLVFVGAVAPQVRACVEAAGDGIEAPAFRLRLERLGDWTKPRIRWAAPAAVPEALTVLVSRLQARLSDCGLAPEKRPFRPHVTLSRKAGPLPPTVPTATPDWPVRDFVLAASRAGRTPSYEVLKRWPLSVYGAS